MTVLTNNERLDRVILDLDGRSKAVRALCISIIDEIDRGSSVSAQRIDQIMDSFPSHISFFARTATRTDVMFEAKLQYGDETYNTSEEYSTFAQLMKVVLDHILVVLGVDQYWDVYKYDSDYEKTYNMFDPNRIQLLRGNLLAVRDFVVVV